MSVLLTHHHRQSSEAPAEHEEYILLDRGIIDHNAHNKDSNPVAQYVRVSSLPAQQQPLPQQLQVPVSLEFQQIPQSFVTTHSTAVPADNNSYLRLVVQQLMEKVRLLTVELQESANLNRSLIEEKIELERRVKEFESVELEIMDAQERESDELENTNEELEEAIRLRDEQLLLLHERLEYQQAGDAETLATAQNHAIKTMRHSFNALAKEHSPARDLTERDVVPSSHYEQEYVLTSAEAILQQRAQYERDYTRSPSDFSSSVAAKSQMPGSAVQNSNLDHLYTAQTSYNKAQAEGLSLQLDEEEPNTFRVQGIQPTELFAHTNTQHEQEEEEEEEEYEYQAFDDWKNAFKMFKPVNKIDPEMAAKYARSSIAASKKHSRKASRIE